MTYRSGINYKTASHHWLVTGSFWDVDFEMMYLETVAWKFNKHELRLCGFWALTLWHWEWNFFLTWWERGKIIRGNVYKYVSVVPKLIHWPKNACWKEPVTKFDLNLVFAACVIRRMYNFYLWQLLVYHKL